MSINPGNTSLPSQSITCASNSSIFGSIEEYRAYYGITEKRLRFCAAGAIVMHPAPINREAEIAGDVADGPLSVDPRYNSVVD